MTTTTRRRFLAKAAAAAALGPSIARAAPSERITIGVIGMGKRTGRLLGGLLGQPDTQVVAVCEVEGTRREHGKSRVEGHYAGAKKNGAYTGCATYDDYRQMLEREDLDAVMIMTPDHMHVHPALAAVKAKCDIYCEKPLTQNIAEGRLLSDAVTRNGIVFQTGSQQRSEFGNRFRTAVEYVWAGRIGKLETIRVGVGGPPKPCDLPTEEQPDNVNWEMWIGPAPMRGYNHVLCPRGVHKHYPAFRRYEEFAGGGLADMGAHHFDIAQWAMRMDRGGPTTVEPPAKGERGLKFTYPNGVEMFHGGPSDCTFEGTEGTIHVGRGRLESTPGEILETPLTDKDRRVYPSANHLRNWLDCVKSREDPICPVETGHRTVTVCHLANLGYKLRRKLTWDPAAERFVDDEDANRLLSRRPRRGWDYPAA